MLSTKVLAVTVVAGMLLVSGAWGASEWVYDTSQFGSPYHWGQIMDDRNAVLYPACNLLKVSSPRRIHGHPIGTLVPPFRVAVQEGERLSTGDSHQQVEGRSLHALALSPVSTLDYTIALLDGGGPVNSLDETRFRPQLSVSMTDPRSAITHPVTGERMSLKELIFVSPTENELASSVALEMQFIMQSTDGARKLTMSVFAVESMTGGLPGLTTILDSIPTPVAPAAGAAPGTTTSSIRITEKTFSPWMLLPSGADYVFFEAAIPKPPCTEMRDTVLLVERVSIANRQLLRLRNRLFGLNSTRISHDLLSHEADYITLSGVTRPDCMSQSTNASCVDKHSLRHGNLARNSALVPPVVTHMSDVSTINEGSSSLYIQARYQADSLGPWIEEDAMWDEGALVIASLAMAGIAFLVSLCMLGVSICRNRI